MDVGYGFFYLYALALALLSLGSWLLFRRWRGSSAWRSRAVNATLLALSLLAAFVAAEGYFYFFVDFTDSAMNLLTSKRWVERHFPQAWAFRGRKPWDPDTPANPRVSIAVVGDSITYGQGVERDGDLYPAVLERGLRSRGIDAAVYNLSRPSWDTGQELAAFESASRRGQRFDIVVLGYCLNDIAPFVQTDAEVLKAVSLLRTPPAPLAPALRRSLAASYLYNRFVMLTSPGIKIAERAAVEAYRRPEIFLEYARGLYLFKQMTRAYGARLVVLTFPHVVVPWERYPYRDIHEKLDAFWRKLDVPNFDLLASFERHPVRDLQASPLDTHPNELAHRLAGELLAEKLAPLVGPPPGGQAGAAPVARP